MHSVLVEARVVEVGEKLVLGLSEQFYQGWHGEQIKTGGPMRSALEQVARELVGRPVVVSSLPQTPQQGRPGRASEPVDEHESFVQRARRVLPGEVLPGEG
ncbi:hypothetical protein DYH09_11865 [bacterium CPR1]|nr:hypothetical protein [bacterium CPR1]